MADAKVSVQQGKPSAALGALTEANQLDPSLTEARLALARLYAVDGHPKVALELLEPLGAAQGACGGCVEALQSAVLDPSFTSVWELKGGLALRSKVVKDGLPWERWADEVGASLADGAGKRLPAYVHPREPFKLIRSCPKCSNPARRPPTSRELFGPNVAVKLASRFNVRETRFSGTKLVMGAPPRREGRCVHFPVPETPAVDTANLKRLCFRPVTRERAALTEVVLVYGRTTADLARDTKR